MSEPKALIIGARYYPREKNATIWIKVGVDDIEITPIQANIISALLAELASDAQRWVDQNRQGAK